MKYIRLKKQADFQRLFQKGKRLSSPSLTVLFRPSEKTIMGISIGKKHGKSVKRNHVKRLLREAFRSVQGEMKGHYAFVFAICRAPGRSQEELARELCVNKSTVARALNHLEGAGYVTRVAAPSDKRQLTVYPTEKMTAVLPRVKEASSEWMRLLSEGISEEELAVFDSVLERMQTRAAELVAEMEEERA